MRRRPVVMPMAPAPVTVVLPLVAAATLPTSALDRKSTRLNSSHLKLSRMPSSA